MIEHDFMKLKRKQEFMEKQAVLLESAAIGGGLVGWNFLTNFAAPNATIGTAKNTEIGQKVLSSFFETGIEHGQKGMTLKPSFEQALTAYMNKDVFKDYYYGKEIGKALGHQRDPKKDKRLKFIYKDMINRFGDDPQKIKELRFTPILGSFHRYMNDENSKYISSFLRKLSVEETNDKIQSAEKYGTRAALEGTFMVIDPLSVVTRPLSVAAHERATKKEPLQSGKLSQATGSFFMSPRVYDKQQLKEFLEKHETKKRVVSDYMNLPRLIKKMETQNKKTP